MTPSSNYNDLNQTELYQVCRRAGLAVLPTTPPERMIAYLTGEEEPAPATHPIDEWRHGLMGFILEYWRKLETQITCPAKSRDPRACFQCIDTRVVACIVINNPNEHLIQIHKKPEKREP